MSRPGVQSVFITVTGIDVQPTNGSAKCVPLAAPMLRDLLTLQHGNVASLVNNAMVPAGPYDRIRLHLDTSAGKNCVLVCPAGTGPSSASPTTIALTIPSWAETGLKIVCGFAMPLNGAIHLVVDFNVNSSIVPTPNSGSWHMTPVLRVVQTETVGSIAGTIGAAAMAAAKVSNAACSATNLPTAQRPSISSGLRRPGYNEYTVAFTCDPDDPSVDESAIVPPATAPSICFTTAVVPVAVTTGTTTTVNF
jgi:hypothetical protein